MIEEPGSESIEGRPIATRKDEMINVSSQVDVMTIHSSFPHTFLISDFRSALLFKESAHGLESSTGDGSHWTYHREACGVDNNMPDPQENQVERRCISFPYIHRPVVNRLV